MFGLPRLFLFAALLALSTQTPFFEDIKITSTHPAADYLLAFSRQMSRPYLWIRAKASLLSIPPGKHVYSPKKTPLEELALRAVWAGAILSLSPYALGIGTFAALPRNLSYDFRGTPYHHITNMKMKPKEGDSFTLLNLNICFLPGELPLYFGGVSPPAERVQGITELIKENDPDVVCLYEAHEVDSTYTLYEKLRDNYRHFFVDIGPEPFEFNSGLFVASKYDIIDPQFKAFEYENMQERINKGYFEFKIISGEEVLAHIYTTHLQPYRKNVDTAIREKELMEIIKDIRNEHEQKPNYPIILVGDLNISWGTREFRNSSLSKDFYSPYTQDLEETNAANRTYTAYLGDLLWNNVDEALLNEETPSRYFEIVDWILIYEKGGDADIATTRVDTFDVEHPERALSDHHALFSLIKTAVSEKE